MKIFIGFFGIPRCSKISLPTIVENILKPSRLSGQINIGYHLYHQTHINNPRSGEYGELSGDNYEWFKQYDGVIENSSDAPVTTLFENLQKYGDAFNDEFRSYKNLLLQLHSLQSLSKQATASQADVILYIRPDLFYHDTLNPRLIYACARDRRRVYVPDWQWGFGINDRFSICGQEASVAYGERLNVATEYCLLKQVPLHSESLLQYVLNKQNWKLRTMPLRASRVRIDGEIKSENFQALQTIMGGRRRRWGLQVTRLCSHLP